jgi:hypothetical protein
VPYNLSAAASAQYKKLLGKISENYNQVAKDLPQKSRDQAQNDIALISLMPMAALQDIEITASPPDMVQLIKKLRYEGLPELQSLSVDIKKSAVIKLPKVFDEEVETAAPESVGAMLAKIAQDRLSQNLSAQSHNLSIIQMTHRNEFDLIADGMYAHSSMPKQEIAQEVEAWPYQQKQVTLQALLNPGSTLFDQIKYRLDAITERFTLEALLQDSAAEEVQIQMPTPRYGYDVPQCIEETGLEDPYLDCFDTALELYSLLQQEDHEELTPYAMLLGHRVRAQLTITAGTIINKQPNPYYRPLIEQVREMVSEIHPILSDAPYRTNQPRATKKPRRHKTRSSKPKKP